MSSPNEPGYPRAGDRSGGINGSGSPSPDTGSPAAAKSPDAGDAPPWQRGPRATEQTTRIDSSRAPVSTTAGMDARLNRFISGSAAPAPHKPAEPAELPEAYPSELPDLSAQPPRTPPRKPVERPVPVLPEPPRPAPQSRVQVASRPQGPVRASMQIRRIDPWSTLKVSLVLSVALFFVWMIAVALLYLVLGGMGVWSKLNSNVGDLLTSAGGSSGGELVSAGTIFGGATLIGLVNIVLLSAMATVGAFVYNLITDLVGGVEVTLADRE